MFLVGLELNGPRMRKQAHAAVAISHASILVPFLLGAGLSLWLYPLLSSADVSFTSFALFMGVAMAITAFPVLAQNPDRPEPGQDRAGRDGAWLRGDRRRHRLVPAWRWSSAWRKRRSATRCTVVLGTIAFIAVMFLVVRPLATRLARAPRPRASFHRGPFRRVLVAVMLSALTTEAIGIHAVFGGVPVGRRDPARQPTGRRTAPQAARRRDHPAAAGVLRRSPGCGRKSACWAGRRLAAGAG